VDVVVGATGAIAAAGAKVGFGLFVPGAVGGVKMDRTTTEEPVEPLARVGLGPFPDRLQEAGDDPRKAAALAGDQAGFMEKPGAKHRLHRPHEAPLLAPDQRGPRANQHRATVSREEDSRRQRVCSALDRQAPDLATRQHGGSRVRGAEIKGQGRGHGQPSGKQSRCVRRQEPWGGAIR
jgi:hypothetical protein